MASRKFTATVINRDEQEFTRERSNDHFKVFKNADPSLHPFQREREYTRALNATKMEKMFAKPFLYSLDGHADGVYSMSRVGMSLPLVLSGDGTGAVKLWHLGTQRNIWSAKAHIGRVRGICTDPYGEYAFSCSSDKTVKMWAINKEAATRNNTTVLPGEEGAAEAAIAADGDDNDRYSSGRAAKPINVYLGQNMFNCIDHHKQQAQFVTGGAQVDLWDHERTDPTHSFQWGADSILSVKYNPVDTNVLMSTGSDRTLVLYDTRVKSPLRKLIMYNVAPSTSWNPQESFNFVVANEDHNLYTFDMRNLSRAVFIHEDHVAAVMCVDFAPTGKEFVSGSYDKTVRIWSNDSMRSRDVYHTSRMQKIFSVLASQDNRFALSGSDDTNIRLWKLRSTEQLGQMAPREVAARQYRDKLMDRFQYAPEIARIKRDQRHLPKSIVRAKQEKITVKRAAQRKEERFRTYTDKSKEKEDAKSKRVVKVIK